MGFDAIRGWTCQDLDKNKVRLKEVVVFFPSVCICSVFRGQTVTCASERAWARVHATLPTLRVVHSGAALGTNIRPLLRNYVRQQSLYIPKTEQMEPVIQ